MIRKQKNLNSGVIYEGPSLIDNSPIVCVLFANSKNRKTGDVVQTYIIRQDIDPIAANRTGLDYSICGNCPHRGVADPGATKGLAAGRSCYVNIAQAPQRIYNKYKRGGYSTLTQEQITDIIAERMVRIGSYGDGAAVPSHIWDNIKKHASGVAAYTHQGLDKGNHFMISADNLQDAKKAWEFGKRTFRIVKDYSEKQRNEVICPSSKGVQCSNCGLCDGNKHAKSVVIQAHGSGKKHILAAKM